jgi:hypothetical protein
MLAYLLFAAAALGALGAIGADRVGGLLPGFLLAAAAGAPAIIFPKMGFFTSVLLIAGLLALLIRAQVTSKGKLAFDLGAGILALGMLGAAGFTRYQYGEKPDPIVEQPTKTFQTVGVSLSGGGGLTGGGPTGGGPREDTSLDPAKDDPEVIAYVKKKGWLLYRDMRISDGKRLAYLSVQDREKSFQDLDITADDAALIAKSKTAQVLDLRKVKNLNDDWLKLFAAMPQLEGIIINGEVVTDAGIQALAENKKLDSVYLFNTKKVTDAGVKALAALPKLENLYLAFFTVDGSAFAAFEGCKTLKSVTLEYMDGFTDDGARSLAKLPNLNELKIGTGFGENKLTAEGIKAIVDARVPAKFEFNKKFIDDALLAALVQKGWLYGPSVGPAGWSQKKPATAAEVRSIVLDGSQVTDKGLDSILDCTNVEYLHVQNTGITDEGLKKLAGFKKLSYLALDKTKVTGPGLEALAGLPIKHIALDGCELTEEAFKAFGKISTLEELWLSNTKFQNDWLKHIAGLQNLKELTCRQTAFDDTAAQHLMKLPKLRSLSIGDTQLGDKGFQELVKIPSLESLSGARDTKVSSAVYDKAKKDYPKLGL